MVSDLKQLLLQAPSGQMDDQMRSEIMKWSDPPTVDEITATRNIGSYSGLCSDFVISVLNIMIDLESNPVEPCGE